ncbi:hypothetical protein SLE2022_293950 [Rubroshorea leprosula]
MQTHILYSVKAKVQGQGLVSYENEAPLWFGGAFHAMDELGHKTFRRYIFQCHRRTNGHVLLFSPSSRIESLCCKCGKGELLEVKLRFFTSWLLCNS